MTFDVIEALERAYARTGDIVGAVAPDQMADATPCTDWTVEQLLVHIVAGIDAFARIADGDPLDIAFSMDPENEDNADLLGDDPARAYDAAVERGLEIWQRDGILKRTLKTSNGEIPATALATIALGDALVHGWDLAKSTGQDAEMDPDLVNAFRAFMEKMMKGPRRGFDDPVEAPPGASPTEQLAAWLGRRP